MFIKIVILLISFDTGYAKGWNIENVVVTDTTTTISFGPLNLCLDSYNNPHIVYNHSGTLRYGYKDSGGWHIEILDTGGGNPSLSLDKNNFPHIIYEKGNYLTYMYKGSASGWQRPVWHREEKIDTLINPQGSWPFWISMAMDNNGNPHVVFTGSDSAGISSTWYAYKENNVWHFDTLYAATICNSLRLNKKQLPRFSNFWYGDVLYYSHKEDTGWVHEQVDPNEVPYASWWTTALALDLNERPYIAYKDPYDYMLKCAYYDGNTWHVEVVDSSDVYIFSPRAIAIDPFNRPHIIYSGYYNNLWGLIKYAYRTDGGWVHAYVDTARGDTVPWGSGPLVIDKYGISHWLAVIKVKKGSNYKSILRYGYGKPSFVKDTIMPPFNLFSLYPNPFRDKVFLTLPSHLEKDVKIEVYDMLGRMLLSQRIRQNGALKLNFSDGTYILMIKRHGKILYRQKIMKMK